MVLVSTIESILYFVCVLFICLNFQNGILRNWGLILPHICFHIILSFVYNYDVYRAAHTCLQFLTIVLIKLLVKNVPWRSIMLNYLFLYTCNALLVASISCLLVSKTINYLFLDLCINIATCLIVSIISFTPLNNTVQQILCSISFKIKFLVLCLLGASTILAISIFDDNFISAWPVFSRLSLVIFIFSLGFVLPVLIVKTASNFRLKQLTNNYRQQIEAQSNYYMEISKLNYELRRFRHDYKNIKIGVARLISDGKGEEALDMLQEGEREILDCSPLYDTGNGIVDALLSDKQRNASSSNITIVFEGSVPSKGVSSTELCVIFGNTVDNAVEACEKIDTDVEKVIDIKCKYVAGFMFLNITNPVNEPVTIKNNTIQTTKSDKTLHGFGLYSLEKTVSSHDGKIELLCNDNQFSVNISMLVNS